MTYDFGAVDGGAIAGALDRDGYARLPGFMDATACAALAALWDTPGPGGFRSTIQMARHGYGRGEYRYFASPMPVAVQALRADLYPPLAHIANLWAERLGQARRWPATQAEVESECAAAGQTRPTPLLLRYGPGDYNRLHQDLYGEIAFPLQAIVLLDRPGEDFAGGVLVLSEARVRMQSRPIVVPFERGDLVVIPVRKRPIASPRGWSKATMRHGVSEVKSGLRRTLGVIFHGAA